MIDDTRNRVHPNAASSGGTVKAGCAARWLSGLATVALIWLAAPHDASAEPLVVSVVKDREPGVAAAHGLGKLTAALRAKGFVCEDAATPAEAHGKLLLVAGLGDGGGPTSELLKAGRHPAPQGPEALAIRRTAWEGKPVCATVGSDDRGLMYGLLDVADRIGWSTDRNDPFANVRDVDEKPAVPARALSMYTMNRAYWESRFYDQKYWARYLDLLARNRFNSVVVIFRYENGGFLAPCYPYFFDVEQFPDVRMVGITRVEQQLHLAAFTLQPAAVGRRHSRRFFLGPRRGRAGGRAQQCMDHLAQMLVQPGRERLPAAADAFVRADQAQALQLLAELTDQRPLLRFLRIHARLRVGVEVEQNPGLARFAPLLQRVPEFLFGPGAERAGGRAKAGGHDPQIDLERRRLPVDDVLDLRAELRRGVIFPSPGLDPDLVAQGRIAIDPLQHPLDALPLLPHVPR